MSPRVVEQRSDVAAPIDQVWQHVVSPEGINDEMRPWMTMSMPRGTEDLTIDTIEVGVPSGRAWIRLFGLLPIDYDHLSLVALEPGRSFHEKSTMLSMRSWQHERTLTPVTDTRDQRARPGDVRAAVVHAPVGRVAQAAPRGVLRAPPPPLGAALRLKAQPFVTDV